MKRSAWILCAVLLVTPALAVVQDSQPAFLDAPDQITVWLPTPEKPESIASRAIVTVDGKLRKVISASGRENPSFTPSPTQVVLPGTIQTALGATEWDPNGHSTLMRETSPGIYEFVAKFPKGTFEYKVARGGSWTENYGAQFEPGGANITLTVPQDNTIVKFIVDFTKKTIADSINNPSIIKAPTTVPNTELNTQTTDKFSSFSLKLSTPIVDPATPVTLTIDNHTYQVFARNILNSHEFIYANNDLGPTYSKKQTQFKVWSPVSTQVDLLLFNESPADPLTSIKLQKGETGIWFAIVPGDLKNKRYVYRYTSYGQTWVGPDIYAKAATANSRASVILDLKDTNPPGWPVPRLFKNKSPLDAIIYEIHIRDFTVAQSSGLPETLRGKYLGLTKHNTTLPNSTFKTGLDYLKWLGITHVHLLPFQNYNPDHSNQYNWGYETTLFNVPEEQYSTNPQDPLVTINQTKQMIQAMQKKGIGVIQDVVYNHSVPSQGKDSAFWAAVPYFYFRTNDRGDVLNESGVGNALNDDSPMVRKFISDSLIFWATEYRLDGFRFDLLGMFTPETINELAQTIRSVNPQAIIYGEPWTGGGPNRSPKGSLKGMAVAVFNDGYRNLLKGGLDDGRPGFIDGILPDSTTFYKFFSGSIDVFTETPPESINYVTAHDNLTLWDAISLSRPNATQEQKKASLRIAMAAVLLAQGIPFWEGGAEIGRTKGGNHNSYNAGDEINKFDWQRALDYQDTALYFKTLVQIRKDHPAFRIQSADQVRKLVTQLPWQTLPQGCIGFKIDGKAAKDTWKEIIVVFNLNQTDSLFSLPDGRWKSIISGPSTVSMTVSGTLPLPPLSATLLTR